jgi:hypothetical protein
MQWLTSRLNGWVTLPIAVIIGLMNDHMPGGTGSTYHDGAGKQLWDALAQVQVFWKTTTEIGGGISSENGKGRFLRFTFAQTQR